MGFRAVGTNNGVYVGIGGASAGKDEDPTKEYVNVYVRGQESRDAVMASVDVKYLMESLQTEGFIESFTLPQPPPIPLSLVERVAKALMESHEGCQYSDTRFRDQVDYSDYVTDAKELLAGDD